MRLPVTHFDVLRGCNAKLGIFRQGFRVVCPLDSYLVPLGFVPRREASNFLEVYLWSYGGIGGSFEICVGHVCRLFPLAVETLCLMRRTEANFAHELCLILNPSSVSWKFVSLRRDTIHTSCTQNVRSFPSVLHISLAGSAKRLLLVLWLSRLADICYTSCLAFPSRVFLWYISSWSTLSYFIFCSAFFIFWDSRYSMHYF